MGDLGKKRTFLEFTRNFASEIVATLFSDDDEDTRDIQARIEPQSINIPNSHIENDTNRQCNQSMEEESKIPIELKFENMNRTEVYFGELKKSQKRASIGSFIINFDCCNRLEWEKLSKKDELQLKGEPDNFELFKVWFKNSLLGYVKKDLSLLIKLMKGEMVHCSVTKNSSLQVIIKVYLGKKNKMLENEDLALFDDEEKTMDWEEGKYILITREKMSPAVAGSRKLLEEMGYDQSRKALIENLLPNLDFMIEPPKIVHQPLEMDFSGSNLSQKQTPVKEHFAGNIYDPFTKTTLAELLEKQKGNSKFSNESQCLPDIFDELRDEDDKKRCEEANEDDNDVELIRIFENQDRGMDIETNMRQKIFGNLKLNRLKFKELPPQIVNELREYQK